MGTFTSLNNPVSIELDKLSYKYLYISDNFNNRIRKLDLANNSIMTTAAIGVAAPYGLAYDPYSSFLYVVSNSASVILRLPLSSSGSSPLNVTSNSSYYILAGSRGKSHFV